MVLRVQVSPKVLAWAEGRSGADPDELRTRFPKLDEWLTGAAEPTYKQLEKLAKATHTPVALFLLPNPPVDALTVRDFRTIGGRAPAPTPNLLDTIADCERRQDWYRQYLREEGADPLAFVGSVTTDDDPVDVASQMHEVLEFGLEDRTGTWEQAFTALIERAEDAGVLVMVNGVVGSNTHRPLDPTEFRGFSLVDDLAPVAFVNGADTKAAQIFTLAHELAHLWLGVGGVDDVDLTSRGAGDERWCNDVAAEFLVPAEFVRGLFRPEADLTAELERIARVFKVSTLVVLRRLADVGDISWGRYRSEYPNELARIQALRRDSSGGDYLNTQPRRVSKPFARALLERTLSGRTTYGESFRLMSTRNPATLRKMAERLGVVG